MPYQTMNFCTVGEACPASFLPSRKPHIQIRREENVKSQKYRERPFPRSSDC